MEKAGIILVYALISKTNEGTVKNCQKYINPKGRDFEYTFFVKAMTC